MSAAKRQGEPGPEEEAELAREEQRAALDEVTELDGEDEAEESDGELTEDELLDIDQSELDELGLTLDDPHQPDDE